MASAALDPFDPASLDIRTSASMSTGANSPQTTAPCVTISLRSFLCCVTVVTLLAVPRLRNRRLEHCFGTHAIAWVPVFVSKQRS